MTSFFPNLFGLMRKVMVFTGMDNILMVGGERELQYYLNPPIIEIQTLQKKFYS
ncbi:MAG: hypothetical protein CM15mP127_07920 [Gammaproteobacteria bacterium]|nr:MAG: hypothetical protein CM15mP127_07920 [Gammaproteobacteria bacterium]